MAIAWKLIIIFYAITASCDSVKVNMQASLHLGKEVADTITHFLQNNDGSGRRSLSLSNDIDKTRLVVKFASLCQDLNICKDKTKFVDEYVGLLAKAVEHVFLGILDHANSTQGMPFANVLELYLKDCLQDVRKILKNANRRITDDPETRIWIGIIKRISAKFQEAVAIFIIDRLAGDPNRIEEIKKKIRQKLLMAIVLVEGKFERKLCEAYNICPMSNEITKSLNTFLGIFELISNKKIREFMQIFHEELPKTNFYSILNEKTANQFQLILSKMAFSENIATRDLLLKIRKIVEARYNSLTRKTELPKGLDVQLICIILSNLDYFYSKHPIEPINKFVNKFSNWAKFDSDDLKPELREVFSEINRVLLTQSIKLIFKLTNEVNVFLEVTVES